MILKAYNAPWKDNIDLFIEKNGILKGNIEGVFHDTVNHFFTLFYCFRPFKASRPILCPPTSPEKRDKKKPPSEESGCE